MALAIRELTIAQGLDPRDFVMVAFGGAGPMHAAAISQEIGIPRVIVPLVPGMFSAWGMLAADLRHDLVRTSVHNAAQLERDAIKDVFRELEEEGRRELSRQNIDQTATSFLHSLDMRYLGQEHTLPVPVPVDVDPQSLKRRFDEAHQRKYGHHSERDPVEVVNFRVAAIGFVPKPAPARLEAAADASAEPRTERDVFFAGAFHLTPVFDRERLSPGTSLTGPAIVEEDGATTIAPPGVGLAVDAVGNLVLSALERQEGERDG
jgi:N-methylhydantoinase A